MNLVQQRMDDAVRLAIWYPYRWAVSFMPPARELLLSHGLAQMLSQIDREEYRRVRQNLSRVFPGRLDVRALAQEFLVRRVESQLLTISFDRLNRTTLSYYLSLEGLSWLDEALSRGKGAILAFPHFGPTLLPLFGLGLLGYKLVQIASPDAPDRATPAAMAAWHVRRYLEGLAPASVVSARSYLRPTLRKLAENQVVLLAYDGTGGGSELGRRVPATLLGHPVQFPVGALYLALRSGAPLLPIITLPEGDGMAWKTRISPALDLQWSGGLRDTLHLHAQTLAQILESYIKDWPAHWQLWPEFEPGRLLVL